MRIHLADENLLNQEEIEKDVDLEEEGDEERIVGTSDEDDSDVDDTTPGEAEKKMDEGEEILKRERTKNQNSE